VGCLGFFATHYHSLATEFEGHPEVGAKRMGILVEEGERRVVFLYKLEDGVAEGSYGMHCASMCGIPAHVVERAEEAAEQWEHTSRVGRNLEKSLKKEAGLPLGVLSDVAGLLKEGGEGDMNERSLDVLVRCIEAL
jgi:DNA mismatch repair protein MSH6